VLSSSLDKTLGSLQKTIFETKVGISSISIVIGAVIGAFP
jgi:hypothetical protein